MRIKYIGKDNRVRVSETDRFKFMPDGFQKSDPRNEHDEDVKGPLISFHTRHSNGIKRTVLMVSEDFDFDAVQNTILENGWIDLSMYPSVSEAFY